MRRTVLNSSSARSTTPEPANLDRRGSERGVAGLGWRSEFVAVLPGSRGSFAGARTTQQLWLGPHGLLGRVASTGVTGVLASLGQHLCPLGAAAGTRVAAATAGRSTSPAASVMTMVRAISLVRM
jgi:hypothetical protein